MNGLRFFFISIILLLLSQYNGIALPIITSDRGMNGIIINWGIPSEEAERMIEGSIRDGIDPQNVSYPLRFALPTLDKPTWKINELTYLPLNIIDKPQDLKENQPIKYIRQSSWRHIAYGEMEIYPFRYRNGSWEYLSSITIEVVFFKAWNPIDFCSTPYPSDEEALLRENIMAGAEGLCPNLSESSKESNSFIHPLSGTAYRITISQDGIFALTDTYLSSHGMNLSIVDPRNLVMESEGVEIPLYITGESDGRIDPGDAIYFYGQVKKGENDNTLWCGGDFTDNNIYWLYSTTDVPNRMGTLNAAPVNSYPVAPSFSETLHFETNNLILSTYHFPNTNDLWFWLPILVAPVGSTTFADWTLNTPDPAGTGVISIKGAIGGFNAYDHKVSLRLNGNLSTSSDPYLWTANTYIQNTWNFNPSNLLNGNNTLRVFLPGFSDHQDVLASDFFEITYDRLFIANNNELTFSYSNQNERFNITSFAQEPIGFEISNSDLQTGLKIPIRLTGISFSSGTATLEITYDVAKPPLRIFALTSTPLLPNDMVADVPSDLKNYANQADYLIIYHPDIVNTLDPVWINFINMRSSSYIVKAIDIQDIYDEFSYGIFNPLAIRSFLSYVNSNWGRVPLFVLLIGDGTLDYKDYKNQKGSEPAYKNWVPTLMFEDETDSTYNGRYSSDSALCDINSDDLPDFLVGRIPARSYSALSPVLQKIIDYENQIKSGSWYKDILFAADAPNSPDESVFKDFSEYLAITYATSPTTTQKLYYGDPPYNGGPTNPAICQVESPPGVDVLFASDLRDDISNSAKGCAVVSYAGHGSFYSWGKHCITFSSNKLRNSNTQSDIDLLSNSIRLPFIINTTCYTSAFQEPSQNLPILMEDCFLRGDRGAIATFGSNTISYWPQESTGLEAIFSAMFGISTKERRVGSLELYEKAAQSASLQTDRRQGILLGDPAVKVALPAPPAPSNLTASGGNSEVNLLWTAASSGTGYNLYRSILSGSGYTKINGSLIPIGTVTYADTTVINATTYYYYLMTVDSDGFESSRTPIASATPLNSNPPANPTGVYVTDPGQGVVLKVTWNPNGESDISGYTIHYGTSSGLYTNQVSVGKITSVNISGLTEGVLYYFAVTAKNTSGFESSYSNEASGSPHFMGTYRPPSMVDLRVSKNGNDVILAWGKPLTDIFGYSVVIDHYNVYRVADLYNYDINSVPVNPSTDFIVTISNPNTLAYTDLNAANPSDNHTYTYFVLAFDPSGAHSPVSHNNPSYILDLIITLSYTTGNTLLTWGPVSENLSCPGATIVSYNLYRNSIPQGVPDIISHSTRVAVIPAPLTACELTAYFCDTTPAPLYYRVTAIDNRGNESSY